MTQEEINDYNKRCAETCIFDKFALSLQSNVLSMIKYFKNSKFYRIITGHTKTSQVSGSAVNIVFDKELSSKVYDKLDTNKVFSVEKNGKKYIIRQLETI